MSNVIKSFKVIEKDDNIIFEESDNIEDQTTLDEKENYSFIIEKANEEANKIIEDANNIKENYINDAYLKSKDIFEESRTKGFNEGYDNGYDEGYIKGYEEGKKNSDNLIKEALAIKNDYIEMKEDIYDEIEEDVIQLVISICEKVLFEKVEKDKEYIVDLILKGIDSLNATENLTIRVSSEDYDIVKMSEEKILSKASLIRELDIKLDSNMKKGDCVIETMSGSVDMSINDQVEKVKEILNNILASE